MQGNASVELTRISFRGVSFSLVSLRPLRVSELGSCGAAGAGVLRAGGARSGMTLKHPAFRSLPFPLLQADGNGCFWLAGIHKPVTRSLQWVCGCLRARSTHRRQPEAEEWETPECWVLHSHARWGSPSKKNTCPRSTTGGKLRDPQCLQGDQRE